MLSASEFRERWYAAEDAEPLKSFSAEALAGVHLPKAAKTFLKESGLPESAAPFLDFRVIQTRKKAFNWIRLGLLGS